MVVNKEKKYPNMSIMKNLYLCIFVFVFMLLATKQLRALVEREIKLNECGIIMSRRKQTKSNMHPICPQDLKKATKVISFALDSFHGVRFI